jgi:homoserine trans-succinylase
MVSITPSTTTDCVKRNRVSCRGVDKSLARPTSRCILFDVENISFDASLVIYTNSNNIPPIMIINRIHENQNLLSL